MVYISKMKLPFPHNWEGKPRRIGVELEFAGLELAQAAEVVREVLGGTCSEEKHKRIAVTDTDLGDMTIEVDARSLQKLSRIIEKQEEASLQRGLGTLLMNAADETFSDVVPKEIVSPPVPVDALDRIDALVRALRKHRAEGTGVSWMYAFGLHLNPDIPSKDSTVLTAFLQAYVLLDPWLRREMDLTRRLSRYAAAFPGAYAALLLSPEYRPGMAGLIDDYLAYNATRNRALDMLPCFAWLDETRVRGAIDDPLIKARPTFHYRLPNCQVDDAGWTVSREWERWLEVERLAADDARRADMARAFGEFMGSPLERLTERWGEKVTRWL